MISSSANDVKVYNLSAGKSLPDWLTERKRRKLERGDVDVRRRIELIQDFGMPDVSSAVALSPDGRYVFAAGTYKPRVRCYEVNNLAMKFERCVDAEVVKMLVLSDGYEKLVFLEEDRWVEFHVQYGHYFRTRIPKFGRDFAYLPTDAELYIVGSGSSVYRLSLEQGRFMTPLETEASSLNAAVFNPAHWLLSVGTKEGKVGVVVGVYSDDGGSFEVEAWDPRSQERVGILDVAVDVLANGGALGGFPSVTALAAKDGLTLGVGTGAGLSLLYDIRSPKPLLVKDSHNELPIKQIAFRPDNGLVASLDAKAVKFWSEETGKPYTAIEPGPELNSMTFYPNSGLMFMANEAPKVLSYYVPSLGPAPKWCAFLDTITEELEETANPNVYDDYKFVTEAELRGLGLEHLVGTNLLRSYMHGYFLDARLHAKAAALVNPFALDEYKRKRIREKLDVERGAELLAAKAKKAPPVNAALAARLEEEAEKADSRNIKGKARTKGKAAGSILGDDRFSALFKDTDFAVDAESEEYRLLNPALQRIGRAKDKKLKRKEAENSSGDEAAAEPADAEEGRGEEEGMSSDMEEEGSASADSSSDTSDDNDAAYKREMQRAHKQLKKEAYLEERAKREQNRLERLATAGSGGSFSVRSVDASGAGESRQALGARAAAAAAVEEASGLVSVRRTGSGMEATFRMAKKSRGETKAEKAAAHLKERRQSRRSAADITKKLKKPRGFVQRTPK